MWFCNNMATHILRRTLSQVRNDARNTFCRHPTKYFRASAEKGVCGHGIEGILVPVCAESLDLFELFSGHGAIVNAFRQGLGRSD